MGQGFTEESIGYLLELRLRRSASRWRPAVWVTGALALAEFGAAVGMAHSPRPDGMTPLVFGLWCAGAVGFYGLFFFGLARLWSIAGIWWELRQNRVLEELSGSRVQPFRMVDTVAVVAVRHLWLPAVGLFLLPLLVTQPLTSPAPADLAGLALGLPLALLFNLVIGAYALQALAVWGWRMLALGSAWVGCTFLMSWTGGALLGSLWCLLGMASTRWLAAWGLRHADRWESWIRSAQGRGPGRSGTSVWSWLWDWNPLLGRNASGLRRSRWPTLLGLAGGLVLNGLVLATPLRPPAPNLLVGLLVFLLAMFAGWCSYLAVSDEHRKGSLDLLLASGVPAAVCVDGWALAAAFLPLVCLLGATPAILARGGIASAGIPLVISASILVTSYGAVAGRLAFLDSPASSDRKAWALWTRRQLMPLLALALAQPTGVAILLARFQAWLVAAVCWALVIPLCRECAILALLSRDEGRRRASRDQCLARAHCAGARLILQPDPESRA